jgi:hypothetical protein
MRAVRFGSRVRVSRKVTALAAVSAMVGMTAVTTAASAATGGAALRGPGSHWAEVTPNGQENFADVGLAVGPHGTLHVIWSSGQTSGGHGTVHDTTVSARGVVGHTATVHAGQFLITDPDAIVVGQRIYAIWNGDQGTSTSSPHGTFLATEPARGGHWSAPASVPPLPSIPYESSSDSAATGADGKPWVAFTGTDSLTVLHVGHPEREIGPTTCCVYFPGLAVDGKTGGTWIAYDSLTNHQGVFAQRLNQNGTAAGKAMLLPGSLSHGSTLPLNARIGITGRGRGRPGVYVAYVTGYPSGLGVNLLQLGHKPVRLASTNSSAQFAEATVTADPAGGLWVAWTNGDGSAPGLSVRHSNRSVTKFGKALRVALPSGTTDLWKVYIAAEGTRLDIVALLTRHGKIAFWTTQV